MASSEHQSGHQSGLPSRSHASTARIAEDLTKLKTREQTSRSTLHAETVLAGLSGLQGFYGSVQDLLKIPITEQAQKGGHHEKLYNQVLDGSVRLLDICDGARSILSQMKESARNVQMALRRRGGEYSSLESCITGHMNSRKKAKKEVAKCLSQLNKINQTNRAEPSPLLHQDQHLLAVVSALHDATCIAISVFQSLLSFICFSSRSKASSSWSLISRLLLDKGRVACEGQTPALNEVESVDIALDALKSSNSKKDAKVELVHLAQEKLKALDATIEGLEDGLERVLKCLIQTRVALLNNLRH